VIELVEFSHRNVCTTFRHETNDVLFVPTTKTETLDEQPISCNDGFRKTSPCVDGLNPSTQPRLVVDIIVDERGCVDHFEGQGQWHDFLDILTTCDFMGQHDKQRAEAFSTCQKHRCTQFSHLACTLFNLVFNKCFEGCVNVETHHLELVTRFQTKVRHEDSYNGALLNR
jgi:hypothetical protein